MKFEELDAKMRRFETSHDHCVLPGLYMVARLDGRSFTRLTKEVHEFEAPYDVGFRDMMVATVEHLMQAGFRFLYGYTQSDEISLLFHPEAGSFSRKLRKLNSVLAGEASAKFSLLLGGVAVFDSRISQLPQRKDVIDYFRWRHEDAHRNALNSHCYWLLRGEGQDAKQATEALRGLSVSAKNELLFERGINFNDLPLWHKRGMGVYWIDVERQGHNPLTGEATVAQRRELRVDYELPKGNAYDALLATCLG